MKLDELSKVAEIVNWLGQNAEKSFFAYLGTTIISDLIGYGVGLVAIVSFYKTVLYLVDAVQLVNRGLSPIIELRDVLGIDCEGVVTDREIKEFKEKVKELQKFCEEHKKDKNEK